MGHQIKNTLAALQAMVQMLQTLRFEWKELIDSLPRVTGDPKALQGYRHHLNHGLFDDAFFFSRAFGVAKRDVQVDHRDFPPFWRNLIKHVAQKTRQPVESIQRKHLHGKQDEAEQYIFQNVTDLFRNCLAAVQWKP